VRSVSQNDAESEELLWSARGTEGLLETVGFSSRRRWNVCDDEQAWIPL